MTEGNTTTQSALSSKSRGMSSDTPRIPFKTAPEFLNRSSLSDALAISAKIGKTIKRMLVRQENNFRMRFPFNSLVPRTPNIAIRIPL